MSLMRAMMRLDALEKQVSEMAEKLDAATQRTERRLGRVERVYKRFMRKHGLPSNAALPMPIPPPPDCLEILPHYRELKRKQRERQRERNRRNAG